MAEWLAQTVANPKTSETEIQVVSWRLKSVSQRPTPAAYIRQIWERRYFIVADARAKAFQNARGTLLGQIWLILRPFLDSLVYWIIFGILLQTSRGVDNFLGYLVIGVNFFALMQAPLSAGATIISNSKNLIQAFAFPKAALVASWTIRTFLDFIPVFIATLFFIVIVPPHASPTLQWLLIIPATLICAIFCAGLALLTSSITALIPDMKFIWPLLGRFWFFASGVFFSLDRFDSIPTVKSLMEANPAYVFLTICRDALIYQAVPSLATWAYFFAWSIVLFAFGFLVFWNSEVSYGRRA